MPRKKRIDKPKEEPVSTDSPSSELEVETISDLTLEEDLEVEEKPIITEAPKKPKSSGIVKVKVLAGTLGWSEGFYEKGEIFEISKEDLKRFDPRYYQIIE